MDLSQNGISRITTTHISLYEKDWVLDLLGAYHNLQSVPEENNFKELTVKKQ